MDNELVPISEYEKELANFTDLKDTRKMLSLSKGIVLATHREYKAAKTISLAREDYEDAYQSAVKAAELRLLTESRVGELIKIEQEAGRLAKKDTGRPKKYDNNVLLLKDYGLNLKDSERAKKIFEHKDLIPAVVASAIKARDLPTRKDIERAIVAGKIKERNIPSLPQGKFNVIYADPPWRYEFSETTARAIESHYNTLSVEEICDYKDPNGTPVQDKFAEDAVLFLWATQPKIREALQVIEAWGFDYKTGAIWVKDKIGMGYYFREQHELLFVAKKGNMPVPDPENRPASVIQAPRLEHSSKPAGVFELIKKMYPKGKYLELFERTH